MPGDVNIRQTIYQIQSAGDDQSLKYQPIRLSVIPAFVLSGVINIPLVGIFTILHPFCLQPNDGGQDGEGYVGKSSRLLTFRG